MTHWLALIPYLPAWSGWTTMARTVQEMKTW